MRPSIIDGELADWRRDARVYKRALRIASEELCGLSEVDLRAAADDAGIARDSVSETLFAYAEHLAANRLQAEYLDEALRG